MENETVNIAILLENSARLNMTESWEHSCATWIDRPVSAADWKMAELTGEQMLDELPPLQVYPQEVNFYN